MRITHPISDDDYTKLVAIFGERLTRSYAETIVAAAADLCDFREVFGQDSRVAKFLREEGDKQYFRLSMFEGKKYKFDVEYDPATKMVTRVL